MPEPALALVTPCTRSVSASDSRDMGTGAEEIEDRAKEADIEREVDHAEGSHEVKEIEKESAGANVEVEERKEPEVGTAEHEADATEKH